MDPRATLWHVSSGKWLERQHTFQGYVAGVWHCLFLSPHPLFLRKRGDSLFLLLFQFPLMAFVGFFDGMGLSQIGIRFSQIDQLGEVPLKNGDLRFGHVFHTDQPVAGSFDGGHEFIEFQVNGLRVLVLAALNEKHHQESDNRRAGVNDELPGIGETKERAADQPDGNDETGEGERGGRARPPGG
jgi:hypothetical protein